MRNFFIFIFIIIAISIIVVTSRKGASSSQKIVNQAIAQQGMDQLEHSIVEFDFRDRHYRATRRGGDYVYERIFTDSTGQVHDSLSNTSFTRYINGELVSLTEEKKDSYSNSVNSVIYFALLPYFLNDPAVQQEFLGESQIKGEPYHKIKVTFRQEGGGKDHEDEYIYWFHQENKTMDYLAYNYQVEGGGARFRAAYNPRTIEGIRFADYRNYKPADPENLAVATFDSLYNADELKLLSTIESENIQVQIID